MRTELNIPDNFANFHNWLKSYGYARHGMGFLISPTRDGFARYIFNYQLILSDETYIGQIRFSVKVEDAEMLLVTLDPSWDADYHSEARAYFNELMAAIQHRWLQPKVEEKQKEPPQKHQIYKCNQWLIKQYFDEKRTNYKDLVDEWLTLRTEEYKTVPTNPIASMRTVIHEERERRETT